jgi:DNA-directed RNA polymerase subunit alpha
MSDLSAELFAFFETGEVGPETYERVGDLALATFHARERFIQLVEEYRQRVERGQGEALKLAVSLLILGRFEQSYDWFSKTPDSKQRRFYAARAALGLGRHDQALAELNQAAALGWDSFETDMQAAAIRIQQGDLPAAEQLAARHAAAGQDRADWYYVSGLIQEYQNQREAAVELYERGLTLDPDHAQAMFRAARLYDIMGADEQAIELYQRLSMQPNTYVNALINLSVIYEDIGRYDDALECLQRVLKAYPNHHRARLFYKDVLSCRHMIVEEGGDEHIDLRTRMLDTPISEFELSVRARNCLKKMNIRSLADLVKLSEPELLSYKNFGETSLAEIRALLTKRGLRLGQSAEEIEAQVSAPPIPSEPPVVVPPGREAILLRPVSELELSVRARRCLQRLNVTTLDDLVHLSEQDLLSTRNFGVTSLNEIKARLVEHGLQLATRRPE